MNDDARPRWLDDEIARLPRQMSPPRNLWPGIFARIARPARASRTLSLAVAASVLLSGAAALFAYQSYRLQAQQANYVRATIDAVVVPYHAAGASHEAIWSARRADANDEIAAEIDRNLVVLRTAQAQLRASLELDPDDAILVGMLRFVLQRELDLLQQASGMSTHAMQTESDVPASEV